MSRWKYHLFLAGLAMTSLSLATVVYVPNVLHPLVDWGVPIQALQTWPIVGYSIQQAITPQISVQALETRLQVKENSPDFVLVDVRTPEEYQAGHIPGAVLISLAEIEAGSGITQVQKLLANRGLNRDLNRGLNQDLNPDLNPDLNQSGNPDLIVYCAVGPRSHKALARLRQEGIFGTNLTGGYRAWERSHP